MEACSCLQPHFFLIFLYLLRKDPYIYLRQIFKKSTSEETPGKEVCIPPIKGNLLHVSKKLCQERQILKTNMEKNKLLAVVDQLDDGVSSIRQDVVWLEEQLQHEE